jgi:aryl-alcohol dehydrogenase-like predicted oxidoreductase
MGVEKRRLGASGIEVSALGLGCLSFSPFYAAGGISQADADALVGRAIDLGINFFDTAAMYAGSEELLGKAIKGNRKKLVIATKFGVLLDDKGRPAGIDGRPETVKRSCEESLGRLGIDVIDLFYLHRIDRAVPIEETVGALAELVRSGKIRAIGFCEVSASTLRRAHSIHKVAALQSEYSLWSRDLENTILPCCRELGIAVVPYSPLGRGFLSGQLTGLDRLGANDARRAQPRFQEENFASNQVLLEGLGQVAGRIGARASQVALAWLLRRGDQIVPIPGTRHIVYLEQNAAAAQLRLSDTDMAALDKTFAPDRVAGARISEAQRRFVDTEADAR